MAKGLVCLGRPKARESERRARPSPFSTLPSNNLIQIVYSIGISSVERGRDTTLATILAKLGNLEI